MSKHLTLVLLLVALVGLLALVRVYWGGDQGLMFVWKTQPSFTDTVVYLPEVTALPKEDLDQEHPGIWEELVAMDVINAEQEAKLAQIRQKRMKRLAKAATPKVAKKPDGKTPDAKAAEEVPAKQQ